MCSAISSAEKRPIVSGSVMIDCVLLCAAALSGVTNRPSPAGVEQCLGVLPAGLALVQAPQGAAGVV
jgi:hypothetical protein